MYKNIMKPKNIIKIMLTVTAAWLIATSIHDTFSSYDNSDERYTTESQNQSESYINEDSQPFEVERPHVSPDENSIELIMTANPASGTVEVPIAVSPGDEIIYTVIIRNT